MLPRTPTFYPSGTYQTDASCWGEVQIQKSQLQLLDVVKSWSLSGLKPAKLHLQLVPALSAKATSEPLAAMASSALASVVRLSGASLFTASKVAAPSSRTFAPIRAVADDPSAPDATVTPPDVLK